MVKEASVTPIRRQYLDLKARYPHAILFFRLGDFYETFDDDARTISKELDVVLTSRPMGNLGRIPMAGVPHHTLDGYLAKLVSLGHRVAICEQMGDPAKTKGIVPREVVRVVSPGTVVEPQLLENKRNNYLAAFCPAPSGRGALVGKAGVAYIDITTSEFGVTQLDETAALAEIDRLGPSEVLVTDGVEASGFPGVTTAVDGSWFDIERARETVLGHFGVASLEGFGCEHLPLAVAAAGAVLRYLEANQATALTVVAKLFTYTTDAWMYLDPQTRRNLELFQRGRESAREGSLLSVLDLTETPMGGRMLRRWLERPLIDLAPLQRRLDGVAGFHAQPLLREEVRRLLQRLPDMERLINRVAGFYCSPRDVAALARCLNALPALRQSLETQPDTGLATLGGGIPLCTDAQRLIAAAIIQDPPAAIDEGEVIRPGFSDELDDLRQRTQRAQQAIVGLERVERERTGIKSLKVGYNRVFGYYLEVSNVHQRLIPEDYLRKQTLVGAERFYTPELKTLETTILTAQDRLVELERELFRQVCAQLAGHRDSIARAAAAIAELDCFAALAESGSRFHYVRPEMNEGEAIEITGGRHPVVERYLADGAFVANDTHLSTADRQIAIITGPNMSGKSTYLRQVAVIALMAQIGSFVPATSASIGIVDRIFSRVGAQDDLATGQSTFMVEMVETANILNHATPRSLVILDEIGRGTSTFDGMSIAQAVVEYLHNQPATAAKTLFATHYHELTALERHLPRVVNLTSAVAETEAGIVFLHRILPGGADRSYGIHVAKLAGLPEGVVRRAEEVLEGLEQKPVNVTEGRARRRKEHAAQLTLLPDSSPFRDALTALELDSFTPIQALTKLYELQRLARDS